MTKIQVSMKKIVDILGRIYLFLSCAMLVVCVGSTVAGVFCRFILSNPLDWVEEMAGLTQAWMVFLMLPQMDIKYDHIIMGILYQAAERKIKLVIRVAQSILSSVLAIYLMKFSIALVLRNSANGVVTATLLLPYSLVYLPLCMTFGFMVIVHAGKMMTMDFQLSEEIQNKETEVMV